MEIKKQSPVRVDGCPICKMNDLPNYIVSNDLWPFLEREVFIFAYMHICNIINMLCYYF